MYYNYLLFSDLNIDNFPQAILFIPNCAQLLTNSHSPTSYTRVTNSSKSTIDVALTTNPVCTNKCTTVPPLGSSDHYGLFASIDLLGPRPKPNKPRKIWRYNHGNFSLANDLLCELDPDSIVVEGDPNATWINWRNSFLKIMQSCIPRSSLPKRKSLPWLSKHIIQLMRKRNMYFKKSKSSPTYASRYKELWNSHRKVTFC